MQNEKLHRRAKNLINQTACTINIRSITNANKKHAYSLVKQCLQENTIEQFQDYFKMVTETIAIKPEIMLKC